MQIIKYPSRKNWDTLCRRPAMQHSSVETTVRKILDDIKLDGDKAIRHHTQLIDGSTPARWQVSAAEIEEAEKSISADLKKAIDVASENIRKFHAAQKQLSSIIEPMPGVKCWQKAIPIEKIGLYIPGGTAPLFSTVLMLAIPASIAGCGEVVMCTPPARNGTVHPAILYAAQRCGIKNIYKIGGAMAIGAMAYGTETVSRVYKIFGPGNQYVTAAKMLVNREGIAIDMPAGPSEVVVIADNTANPHFICWDLLSQAEHGPDSQVLLLSTKEEIIQKVLDVLPAHLDKLERKEFAKKSLEHSACILFENDAEMMDFCNTYAPEHLIIETEDFTTLGNKVINAGSVFLGHFSPESAGDYASGTNHTLPTSGYARVYSGVNLDSFMKKITFQWLSEDGFQRLAPTIEIMASQENLQAHKTAVSIRIEHLKKQ